MRRSWREDENLMTKWINTVRDLGWSWYFIKKQINHVVWGIRDGRLHDETCHIISVHPDVLRRIRDQIVARG